MPRQYRGEKIKHSDTKSSRYEKVPIGPAKPLHVEVNGPHGAKQRINSPCGVGLSKTKRVPGRKEQQKLYRRHTGYPGGLIETGAAKMRSTKPAKMIELAISGMLPKNKLGKQMYRKLNVYAGDKHPHQAQKPVELVLEAQRKG